MKFMLDSCISGGTKGELEAAGHEVVWAGDWDADPGDEEILARALVEGRIVVTIDKDFGELAVLYARPHGGILRLVNFRARQQGSVCLHVAGLYGAELEAGALVTAEPGRVRVRPADS